MQESSFQPARRGSRVLLTAVVALLLMLNAEAALAQFQVNWTKQNLLGPPARIEDTLVYDSNALRLVMFGGYDLDWNRLNDIWEYDGATTAWTEVTPLTGPQPPPRSGQAMAFDPVRNVVVLFGGLNSDASDFLGDTWEWSTVSKTWTNVTPVTTPTKRQGARLVYDPVNSRTLLIGGVDDHGYDDETWAWKSGTWTLLSGLTPSGPKGTPFLGRTFPGAAYDSVRHRITVFGGIGRPRTATQPAPPWTSTTPGRALTVSRGRMSRRPGVRVPGAGRSSPTTA